MDAPEYRWPRMIVLSLGWICSTTCYLLVVVSLWESHEITRKRLHHHVILALLACNFLMLITELPITLLFSYFGRVPIENDRFCAFWVVINYGLYAEGSYLMAFASIERYFLIFHDRFVYRWRLLVHYLPILFCIIYPLLFFSFIVNVYPCDHVYYYDVYVCGGDCYQFQTVVGTIDYMIDIVFPVSVIVLANLVLLVRVTLKKRAMKRGNTWRKSRLMYIQLLSVSILYSIVWIPFVIVSLIRLFYDPFFLQDVTVLILNYFLYLGPLASPFIALIGLPGARQYLRENRYLLWFKCGIPAHNQIQPVMSINTRTGRANPARRAQHTNSLTYTSHRVR